MPAGTITPHIATPALLNQHLIRQHYLPLAERTFGPKFGVAGHQEVLSLRPLVTMLCLLAFRGRLNWRFVAALGLVVVLQIVTICLLSFRSKLADPINRAMDDAGEMKVAKRARKKRVNVQLETIKKKKGLGTGKCKGRRSVRRSK